MLEALRNSVNSWIVKAFIGVIMLSFAVWGVSDVFTGYRGTEVARVGETEIPSQVFRDSLQREIQSISQQVGTYLTMDQARTFGLDQRVLGRLIAEAALDDEARRRGLGMSEAAIADSIRSDPSFRGPGGQFDRAAFNQFLRATGYSEAMFVADQRQRLMRRAIGEAVGGTAPAPDVLAKAIDRYQNEERSAAYVLVTADMLDQQPEPSEEELQAFFEDNRSDFRAPEYRRVAMIPVEPEDIVERIEVSDEDARAEFEARADQYMTAERRTIEQLTFASMEDAQQARQQIEEGDSFEAVAEELGVSEADRVLGTLEREDVVDQAIAEAAFALEEGEVSDPVDGTFSPVLIRVSEVHGEEVADFEAVADEVRQQLATSRAQGEILDIYDQIEDDRAAGMTLAEIAERHGLPFREIERIDRRGQDEDGHAVADLPQADQLVSEIFETDAGIEADPVQIGAEGYAWFDVLDIYPSRDREFDEAREDVAEAWREARVTEEVNALAEQIADQIRGGASLDVLAEEMGLAPASAGPLTRGSTTGDFGSAATGRLFTTPKGAVAVAEATDPLARVVFQVTEVSVPDYTPTDGDRYAERIAEGLSEDLMGQYIAQLQDELGVSINQRALRQALGEQVDDF